MLSLMAVPSAHAAERPDRQKSAIQWVLTPKQLQQANDILTKWSKQEQVLNQHIEQQRLEIAKLFLEPTPDESAIFSIQDQIDKQTQERDEGLITTSLKIRALLTPEQRGWMGVPDPSQILANIKLSPGQRWSYAVIMRSYLEAERAESKGRADLNFERELLLQEVDLVLGCHAQKLDVPALFAKQKEISDLDGAAARRRLQLIIGLYAILSDEQKEQLRKGEAQIKILDPVAVKDLEELRAKVPSPDAAFEGIRLLPAQKSMYQQIVGVYVRALAQRINQREILVAQQRKLISEDKLDEGAIAKIQEKLISVDANSALAREQLIIDTRNVLTSEQRHAVFNRHHPKIWSDAGINAEQDKKLMDYHMKIEEADREGKRKMIHISQDIKSLYYQPIANDNEMLTLQRQYNQAEADTVHKQLIFVIKNRTVLSEAQKRKLVQLMRTATHPAKN